MNSPVKILQIFLVSFFLISSIFPQDQKKELYTAQEVYAFFNEYSPNDVTRYAKAAADFLSEFANEATTLDKNEEEALFGQALKDFNKLSLQFKWEKFPLLPFIVPQRCDEYRVVAHPIPAFFGMMSQKGFLKHYKDTRGKKIALELCQKIISSSKGVWGFQYQWWPLTDKPLKMGIYLLPIPNTPYQVHTFYPTQKYDQQQLNNALNDG